jgi:hypothetical protein
MRKREAWGRGTVKPRCQRCLHPDYTQDRAIDGRPRFTCRRCGARWTCGQSGGRWAVAKAREAQAVDDIGIPSRDIPTVSDGENKK